MRNDEHFGSGGHAKVRWASLAVISIGSATAIIGSLQHINSPALERRQKSDAIRQAALESIDNAVMRYHRAYRKLPNSLGELADAQHWRFPRDPTTRNPYEYELVDETAYRLCATFSQERILDDLVMEYGPYMRVSTFDEHPAGPHCFDQEVEPLPPVAEPAN